MIRKITYLHMQDTGPALPCEKADADVVQVELDDGQEVFFTRGEMEAIVKAWTEKG